MTLMLFAFMLLMASCYKQEKFTITEMYGYRTHPGSDDTLFMYKTKSIESGYSDGFDSPIKYQKGDTIRTTSNH